MTSQSEHLYREIQTLERQLRERDEEIVRLLEEGVAALDLLAEIYSWTRAKGTPWARHTRDLLLSSGRLPQSRQAPALETAMDERESYHLDVDALDGEEG